MNDMEKNQVSESEDFAAMLEETMVKFRPGQVVKGVVAQVSDDGVVVSIPGKADGFIKKNDLVTTDCKVDDEIEAEVVKLNDGEGYVLLSERKVMATKNWEKLVAEYDEGAYVEATGREAVNGGLIADVMGVRAFIPASHLSRRFVENIGEFVGKTMTVKIIEVDKAKKRIVASRKAVLQVEEEAKKAYMSSTKSMTGHMLGAAGAVEAIACLKALNESILPPTINLLDPDPACDLNNVPNVAIHADVDLVLSNSLGFGGHNACIAFRKVTK